MPIEGVVADANVLLSAVVGKAALRVISDFDIVVHVSQFNADEVAEYLPLLSAKYDLQIELVEMQWKLLPSLFIRCRITRAGWHELSMR